ncbi:MAG TPA: hypothetical protein VKS24_25070 [Bradyrhizobium sp.]|nr:hypothetical protein [Bradyrhizobium sp.]
MMSPYVIRDCRLADLRALVPAMRAADRSEIEGAGMVPRHALFDLWRRSPDPQIAEIRDGAGWRIAAAWGDCGTMLNPIGSAWLFTTDAVELAPLAFFRHARSWAYSRLDFRKKIVSSVRSDYTSALRFFAMMGFSVGEPQAIPPHGIAYSMIELRRH